MPLTRNLYREDEVLTALQYCILKGRLKEAIFWAHELVISNMTGELLQRMLWLWMNFFGSAHLAWYGWFHEATADLENVNEEAIYLLVMSLGRAAANKRYDSTVFSLLVCGLARSPTDRIGFAVLPESLRRLEGVEKAFATAIKQGKLELAWSLWPSTGWQILEELGKEWTPLVRSLSRESERPLWKTEWVWATKALALVIVGSLVRPVCIEREKMLAELQGCWTEWDSLKMRAARWATIPYECLHMFTHRVADTEKELMGGLEAALPGSQFWDEVSELHREEFFDTYFTSDIPDEWSSADRQKSHGAAPTPTTSERTFNRWFAGIPSKGFWGGIESAIAFMTERWSAPVGFEATIHEGYEVAQLSKTFGGVSFEPVKIMMECI
jgi:hypothetical protein